MDDNIKRYCIEKVRVSDRMLGNEDKDTEAKRNVKAMAKVLK